MSLNIKSQRAHDLASDLAQRTGESLTTAVTRALEERLQRLQAQDEARKQRIIDDVNAIVERIQQKLVGPPIDHGEFLYGDDGLPK